MPIAAYILGSIVAFSPPSQAPTWQTVLERLTPYALTIHQMRDSDDLEHDPVEQLLVKLHLAPRTEQSTQKQIAGYYSMRNGSRTSIQGVKNGSIILLLKGKEDQIDAESGGYIVFYQNKGKMQGFVAGVTSKVYDDLVFPESAVLTGNKLVVSGEQYWLGNAQSASVRSYQRTGNRFRLVSQLDSPYELVSLQRLHLAKNGLGIEPVVLVSRTYPVNLSVSHAEAQIIYDEKWGFRSGKPYVIYRKKRETPFSAVDELYGAVRKHHTKTMRARCLNSPIYNQLLALGKNGVLGDSGVRYPKGGDPLHSQAFGLTSLDRTLHFKKVRGKWLVWKIGPTSDCVQD